jgi:hypothetical protein
MKKTAVDWFEEEFNKYYAFSIEEKHTFNRIFSQAKEMEKEQIECSFHSGMIKHSLMILNDELPKTFDDLDKIIPFKEGAEYYNQTYKL